MASKPKKERTVMICCRVKESERARIKGALKEHDVPGGIQWLLRTLCLDWLRDSEAAE